MNTRCLTREDNANLVSLWGASHGKEANCFMSYFYSVSRVSLTRTLESLGHTLLNSTRKRHPLEMVINAEMHTGPQRAPRWC